MFCKNLCPVVLHLIGYWKEMQLIVRCDSALSFSGGGARECQYSILVLNIKKYS